MTETQAKIYDLYKEIYKTDKEPTLVDLSRLFVVMAQAAKVCDDAAEQVGQDVLDLVNECTTVSKNGTTVNVDLMMQKMGIV